MKHLIKDFLFFFKASKDFTGYGYLKMIFREKAIRRAFCFCRQMRFDRKMTGVYGDKYYAVQNRVLDSGEFKNKNLYK